jgi:hypothetical protein
MADQDPGLRGYEGIFGQGMSLQEALALSNPKPQPTAPGAPGVSYVTAVDPQSPITDAELAEYAISAADLARRNPGMTLTQPEVAEFINRAKADPTGQHAQLIRRANAMTKQAGVEREKYYQGEYIKDINDPDQTDGGLPEIRRAGRGVMGGILSQGLGLGEEVARTRGRSLISLAGSPLNPSGAAFRYLDRKLTERHEQGMDPGQVLADRSFRSVGPTDPITGMMADANAEAKRLQQSASFAGIYDDGSMMGKAKGVLADAPYNIFQMIPLVASGGMVGGAAAGATEGAGEILLTNPITKRVMSVDLSGLASRVLASLPEAMSEAQSAASEARINAIQKGMDPDAAAGSAYTNTLAGNMALLGVTNNFADGRLMMSTFKKAGANEAAAAAERALAKTAVAKFGKEGTSKALALAEKLGIKHVGEHALDAFGEGFEEYAQRIISQMSANPEKNTWEDFRKAAFSQEAFAEFLGGFITGGIVGAGSKPFERKAAPEAPLLREVKPGDGVKPARSFDPEGAYRDLASVRSAAEASVGDTIEPGLITKALRSAAGLTAEESAALPQVTLALRKLQDPMFANSEEGQAALQAIKPISDKLLAARRDMVVQAAASDFMDGLLPEEATRLREYADSLAKTKAPQVAEPTEEALHPDLVARLPEAHSELQQRRAAIDEQLQVSKAVDEAVEARMATEQKAAEQARVKGEIEALGQLDPAAKKKAVKEITRRARAASVRFSSQAFETALTAYNELAAKMSPAAALGLMQEKDRSMLRLGWKAEQIRAEEMERIRKELHSTEEQTVAEKFAPGNGAMLRELRKFQENPLQTDSAQASALSPEELGEPNLGSGRRTETITGISQWVLQTAHDYLKNFAPGRTLGGMPEHLQMAAKKHGATSMKMARAVAALYNATVKWRGETAIAARAAYAQMNLSKSERASIEGAVRDAVYAARVKTVHMYDAAKIILEKIAEDRAHGVRDEGVAINAGMAVAMNKNLKGIVDFGHSIGLPTQIILEAVVQAAEYARPEDKEKARPSKLGARINAQMESRGEAEAERDARTLIEHPSYVAAIKDILRSLAPSAEADNTKGSAMAGPAFDITKAEGKALTLGYRLARMFANQQRSAWMSVIAKKGTDTVTNPLQVWSRDVVMKWINERIDAETSGREAPSDDVSTGKGKSKPGVKRGWRMTTKDMAVLAQALVQDGVLRQENGRYYISGVGNARDIAFGLNPELIRDAWNRAPFGGDASTIRDPKTIGQELYDGLTPMQLLVLKMYHGLDSMSQSYLSIEQIAKAINQSERATQELLDYATKVIASRFENTALLADGMADRIISAFNRGLMDEGAVLSPEQVREVRDLTEQLGLIAALPGAFSAAMHKTTEANLHTSEGYGDTLFHKGFFPSLHDAILARVVDPALTKKVNEALDKYKAAVKEFQSLKKPNFLMTDPTVSAEWMNSWKAQNIAREDYFSAMHAVALAAPEGTREMLDYISRSMGRRVFAAERGNVREGRNIKAANRALASTREEASRIANAIGETIYEVLGGFGIERRAASFDVDGIIGDIKWAFLSSPNEPYRAAFTEATLGLAESYYANLAGFNESGQQNVSVRVLDEIRNILGLGDRTAAARQLAESREALVAPAEAEVERAKKESARAHRALGKANTAYEAASAALGNARASIMELTKLVTKEVFGARSSAPGAMAGVAKAVNAAMRRVDAIPVGIASLVKSGDGTAVSAGVSAISLLTSSVRAFAMDGTFDSARAVTTSAQDGLRSMRDISGMLRESAASDGLSAEMKGLARAYAKMLDSAAEAIESVRNSADAMLTSSKHTTTALVSGKAQPLGTTESGKRVAEYIAEMAVLQKQEASFKAELDQATLSLAKITKLVNQSNTAVRNAEFRFDEIIARVNRSALAWLPASEEELRRAFGAEAEAESVVEDAIYGPDDIADLTEVDPGVVEADVNDKSRSSRILAREIKASGIRLPASTLTAIATRLLKGTVPGAAGANVRAANEAIETLINESEAAGISIEDTTKMQFGIAALAELAGSAKHARLLQGDITDIDATITDISAALDAVTPGRDASLNYMMATHAVEALTGKRINTVEVDAAAIETLASQRESSVAAVLQEQSAKEEPTVIQEETLEGQPDRAASGRRVLDAIRQAQAQNLGQADRLRIYNQVQMYLREVGPGNADPSIREEAQRLLTGGSREGAHASAGVALGVDLVGVMGLSQSSPEGAAILLGAGIAYLGYKLGMQNPTFRSVMERIKANTSNTVSQLSAKIRGFAKGIGVYTSRLMAAMFKDGGHPDGGSRTEENRSLTQQELQSPASDRAGYFTPEGKARLMAAAQKLSRPSVFWGIYKNTPATHGGRVFSFDIVRDKLIHPGGGALAWVENLPHGVGAAFNRVMEHQFRQAARNGQNVAIVVGGNGAGKTTFMGSSAALETYAVMHETSAFAANTLASAVSQAQKAGARTDIVYVLRNLNDMITGAIVRGAQEERLTYSDGFATALVNGMKNVIAEVKRGGLSGDLVVIDDSTGNEYAGDAALKRLEGLAATLDKKVIAERYRNIASDMLEGNYDGEGWNAGSLKDAVRGWIQSDINGNISQWLSGVTQAGYITPEERSQRLQATAGGELVLHASNPEVLEDGPIAFVSGESVSNEDIINFEDGLEGELVKAGKGADGGLLYVNSGIDLREMDGLIDDVLGKTMAWAKDRLSTRARRSPILAEGRKFLQFVHQFKTDHQTRIMHLALMYRHAADSIVGGLQPTLKALASLRDTDGQSYTMLGRALMDSSVQERVINGAELANRYGLDEEGSKLYRKVVDVIRGIQKVTLAALDREAMSKVAQLRDEQNALDPADEKFDEQFMALEKKVSEFEDETDTLRSIIQKNPVFISLLRNEKATRQLDMVDADGNRIGMIMVDTGHSETKIPDDVRGLAIDQMVRQHANKLWAEADRVGSPDRIEAQLRKDIEAGRIKFGHHFEGRFVESNSGELRDNDHLKFVKMAGGMLTTEVLQEIIDNRAGGVSGDARSAMLRDLRYMAGASDIKGRLKYARNNTAGYSEDIIGALSMHGRAAGYMAGSLLYAGDLREELNAYRRHVEVSDGLSQKDYDQLLNYTLATFAPQRSADGVVGAFNALRTFTAYKALMAKISFGAAQYFQQFTTSRPHMMAMYDTGYTEPLIRASENAAVKLLALMAKPGADLSMIDRAVLDARMDEIFSFQNFSKIWATQEEADRMRPIVKEVMHRVIQGSSFKDVNVGMQIGVEDVAANDISRATHTTKLSQAKEGTKDILTYVANKGENLNRIRDIVSYVVGAATESRAKSAGKKTGIWAQYGYVSISDEGYSRLTYGDLEAQVRQELAQRYRNSDVTKAQLEAMTKDEAYNRIMTFAQRQSAHANFNTGRGFGNEKIWNPEGNGRSAAFMKTVVLFRLYPINVLRGWISDMGITARRLEAEGRHASVATVASMKSTAYGALAAMLLGGSFGPPLAGLLADLMSYIWNLLSRISGKPPIHDVKRDYIEWVREKFGPRTASFAAAGIFGLIPPLYGFGAQLSMGEGPVSVDTHKSWQENLANLSLGANTGAVESLRRGSRRIEQGDYVGGVAQIAAPSGAANLVDAFWIGRHAPGRKPMRGTEEFYQMTPAERAAKAIGVTPQKTAMIYEQDAANRQLKDERSSAIKRLKQAFENGNLTEKNWNEIRAWNDAMSNIKRPDMIIVPNVGSGSRRMEEELRNESLVEERMGGGE